MSRGTNIAAMLSSSPGAAALGGFAGQRFGSIVGQIFDPRSRTPLGMVQEGREVLNMFSDIRSVLKEIRDQGRGMKGRQISAEAKEVLN
jgi:hypothetical protein